MIVAHNILCVFVVALDYDLDNFPECEARRVLRRIQRAQKTEAAKKKK